MDFLHFSSIHSHWISQQDTVPVEFLVRKIPLVLTVVDPDYRRLYPAEKYPGYEFQLPMRAQTTQLRYYAGPLEGDILKKGRPNLIFRSNNRL